MNWAEYFAMGGYALYVWGAYAIAAAVIAYNLFQPILRRHQILKRLRDYYRLRDKTR